MRPGIEEVSTVLDGLDRLIQQDNDRIHALIIEIQRLNNEVAYYESIRTEFLKLPLSEFA